MSRLITSTNAKRALNKIKRAAKLARLGRKLQFDYEHGQWWVTDTIAGATWSCVDAYPGIDYSGIDFEQVTEGEED